MDSILLEHLAYCFSVCLLLDFDIRMASLTAEIFFSMYLFVCVSVYVCVCMCIVCMCACEWVHGHLCTHVCKGVCPPFCPVLFLYRKLSCGSI